ncbi:MAG: hypothetical protein JW768_05565 [Chitinispirillaceae bacterium]|nr:hypothetical protein [Chitinispirillaceae bacterium]
MYFLLFAKKGLNTAYEAFQAYFKDAGTCADRSGSRIGLFARKSDYDAGIDEWRVKEPVAWLIAL